MPGHEGHNKEHHQKDQMWVAAKHQERRLVEDKDAWKSEHQRNETVVLQEQETVLQEAAPGAEVQKEPLETNQGKTVIVEK